MECKKCLDLESRIKELEAQNKKLREALWFYANEHWTVHNIMIFFADRGEVARQALTEGETE